MSSKIPPLLEPYLALPPEASLILLTSVLGASTNWLVLRFLHSALLTQDASSDQAPEEETKVLLVSFMRDLDFWKEVSKRLGLDLDKLVRKKRFGFVDGLSGLFLPKEQKARVGKLGEKIIRNPALANVSEEIQTAIESLKGGQEMGKVVLVVDQPDLLLAAGGDQIGAVGLGELLMELRELAHATIITLSADQPLVSENQTPLETDHAVFLLSSSHQADLIMSLRLLDSGTARDVSGIVRITVGDRPAEDEQNIHMQQDEKDLLYFVGGDGTVKVFERGQ